MKVGAILLSKKVFKEKKEKKQHFNNINTFLAFATLRISKKASTQVEFIVHAYLFLFYYIYLLNGQI